MEYVYIVEKLVLADWIQETEESSSNPSDFLGIAYRRLEQALLAGETVRISLSPRVA
jgi:hypothetical protein